MGCNMTANLQRQRPNFCEISLHPDGQNNRMEGTHRDCGMAADRTITTGIWDPRNQRQEHYRRRIIIISMECYFKPDNCAMFHVLSH